MLRNLGLAVFLVAITACAGSNAEPFYPTPTSDVFHPSTQNWFTKLLAKAAFDFDCDAQDLAIKNLPGGAKISTTGDYGVVGCGKRASYKLIVDVGWVMQSDVTADAN
jgi:hypothetical protein